ncbi:MAG: hypothetical protein EPN45_15665 [Rhizobiaceae bacterium]|nr:MAG: hypothetical protein EPN45_15665 [Rhizobiaceae bacterium]
MDNVIVHRAVIWSESIAELGHIDRRVMAAGMAPDLQCIAMVDKVLNGFTRHRSSLQIGTRFILIATRRRMRRPTASVPCGFGEPHGKETRWHCGEHLESREEQVS